MENFIFCAVLEGQGACSGLNSKLLTLCLLEVTIKYIQNVI